MSRSYKKTLICKLENDSFYKKLSNRKVRRLIKRGVNLNGMRYKRVFNSWDICDWKFCDKISWKPEHLSLKDKKYYYFK